MNQQTLMIGLAALLAGGAGGFVIGQAGGESEEATAGAAAATVAEAKVRRSDAGGADSAGAPMRRVRSTDEALREPGQMARMQSLMDLYAGMSPAELQAEAEQLDNLPMEERIMASMMLFSRWAEIDPLGALAHADSMGRGGTFVKPTILRSWASLDPVNAARYFTENPTEFERMSWGRERGGGSAGADVIAREWAKVDSDGALAWAQGLDGDDRSSAVGSVVGQMAMTDPVAAAAVVATLNPENQARAYGEVAEQWARRDFAEAEAWIATLGGENKDRAMAKALEVLAGSDPQGAASRVAMISDPEHRRDAVRDVASSWARGNPAGAADFLMDQGAADDGRAMRGVMGNWVSQDPAGALSFIESQPAGEGRDNAAQIYLWMNRDADPARAMSLAATISNDRNRERTARMAADRWLREDESSARTYIQQTDILSPEVKQDLLSGAGGRRR